jgi:hypothetical protein
MGEDVMPLPEPYWFLSDYKTLVFIETGSNRGDAIRHALAAGFDCIYSVDISPFAFGWCCHRFRDVRTKVNLFCEDSRAFLKRILPSITTQCTFWLDAHWCGGNGEMEGADGGTLGDVPLLEELTIIRKHEINNHIIIIDDVRLFGNEGYPTLNQIEFVLHKINPQYEIQFFDSPDFEADILIAKVPNEPTE